MSKHFESAYELEMALLSLSVDNVEHDTDRSKHQSNCCQRVVDDDEWQCNWMNNIYSSSIVGWLTT